MSTPAEGDPAELVEPEEHAATGAEPTGYKPGAAEPPAPEPSADRGETPPAKQRSFWRELPVLVLIALVLAILLKTFLVQAFFIPSGSMEPTLVPGDRVLVNKLGGVHRGDIIVFENPHPVPGQERGPIGVFLHWLGEGFGFARPANEDYIKRVIGLPGETVEIRHQTVFIDGKPLDEPYLTPEARAAMFDYGPVQVPQDGYFVLGDNRGHSGDSRFGLGFIPEATVVGKAFVIVWPPSDLGLLH